MIEAALNQYMDRTKDTALILRRLDRLGSQGERHQRDIDLLAEAFATYVQIWFAYAPAMPEDEKRLARISSQSRYRQFVEHVAARFSGGHRFVDDLPREPVADDAELEQAAKAATDAPAA